MINVVFLIEASIIDGREFQMILGLIFALVHRFLASIVCTQAAHIFAILNRGSDSGNQYALNVIISPSLLLLEAWLLH